LNMRTIKFRGKASHSGEWLFGYLINICGNYHILGKDDMREDGHHVAQDSDRPTWVDLETVGQFTGLHDKNGKKIFEGDVIKCGMRLYVCEFIEGGFEFRDLSDSKLILKAIVNTSCIIGNIHDNLELIKKGGQE